LEPAERLSRRSREHRPTIGVLESPQVTPMCLLGGSRWHGAAKHRAAEVAVPGDVAQSSIFNSVGLRCGRKGTLDAQWTFSLTPAPGWRITTRYDMQFARCQWLAACFNARITAIPPFGLGRSEYQLEPRPPRHRPVRTVKRPALITWRNRGRSRVSGKYVFWVLKAERQRIAGFGAF